MSYWKGLLIAFAVDVAWIMGSPSLVTGPEPPVPVLHAPYWVMNQEPGVTMQTSPSW